MLNLNKCTRTEPEPKPTVNLKEMLICVRFTV